MVKRQSSSIRRAGWSSVARKENINGVATPSSSLASPPCLRRRALSFCNLLTTLVRAWCFFSSHAGVGSNEDFFMPSATSRKGRLSLSTPIDSRDSGPSTSRRDLDLVSRPSWSSTAGSPRNTVNRDSLVSLPELRDIRNSNKELLGQIKALSNQPRSDLVTEEKVREKERACVSLRAAYNDWLGKGLARERHVQKLKAEWEAYCSANAAASSESTSFFSSDVDASVTLRGVPSLSEVKSLMTALSVGSTRGSRKSIEKMNAVELRAAMEEATSRLESVELSLTMAKETQAMLDHMIKRFKTERMGEETKYEDVKQSVQAILRQEKEHVLQVKIVGHEEDVARSKIAALQEKLIKVAAKRKNLVTDEKGKMSTKAQLEEYVRERDDSRKTIIDHVAGDMTKEEEATLKSSHQESNARLGISSMEEARVKQIERAFMEIAERTGDDDINSFVNRFLSLVEIGKHADSGKEEMEDRLSELRRTLDSMQNQLTEVQNAGLSMSIRRNEFDQLEDELSEKEKMEAHLHASSNGINHRLSHLRVGVTALFEKIELAASNLSLDNSTPPGSSSGDPTVHQLYWIDSCIERMLAEMDPTSEVNTTAQKTRRQKKKQGVLSESLLEEKPREEKPQDGLALGLLRAELEFNLRVKRGTVDGLTTPSDSFFDTFDEGGYPDDDDDIPGIVPLDGGHVSVAGLAREAKSAVLKHQRREERRRLRQAEETSGRGKTALREKRSPSTSTANDAAKQPGSSKKGSSQPKKSSRSLMGDSTVRSRR